MTKGVLPAVLTIPWVRHSYIKIKRDFAPRSLSAKEYAGLILVDVGLFDQHGADAFLESNTCLPSGAREEVIERISNANAQNPMAFQSDLATDALHHIGTRLGLGNAVVNAEDMNTFTSTFHTPRALLLPLLDINSRLPSGKSGLSLALSYGLSTIRYEEMLSMATDTTLSEPHLVSAAVQHHKFPHILQAVLSYAFDDGTGVPLPTTPFVCDTTAMIGAAELANNAIHQRMLAQERYRRDICSHLTELLCWGRGHIQLVFLVLVYVMGDRAKACKR
ncbi:MAG TPA: hypothetical protein VFG51_01000 [Candidatus Saccharimonadia bacterium]|nr:hypothetical protein [Candidatus Saccharimonadia bacterium]